MRQYSPDLKAQSGTQRLRHRIDEPAELGKAGARLRHELRLGQVQPDPEGDHDQPANELDLLLVAGHDARDRGNAESRNRGDDAIGDDRPQSCGKSAPEAALERPLDADDIDWTDRRCNEHTNDQPAQDKLGARC